MTHATPIIERGFFRRYQLQLVALFTASLALTFLALYLALAAPLRKDYFESLNQLYMTRELAGFCIAVSFALQSTVIGLVILLIALHASHRIAGPLHRLEAILRSVERRRLQVEVRFRKEDKVHALADDTNRMLRALRTRFDALSRAAESLRQAETLLAAEQPPVAELEERLSAALAGLEAALERAGSDEG
jgi:nitrogen fixation/metabolism regulation signal transduction histidine kinase